MEDFKMDILHETDKKITKLFVVTDKKRQPKILEGISEVVLVFSVPEEREKSGSNNKLSHEEIDMIYKQLREGKGAHAIAKSMGISKKTVYNYKSGMIDL